MNGLALAAVSAGSIFSGTLLGLTVRRFLPQHHLSEDSKDAVKLAAGMISMMAALVLGLLVSSAKSNFDSTNQALTESSAKIILIDRLLANYGPETKEVRETLRAAASASMAMLWPEEFSAAVDRKLFERTGAMEQVLQKVRNLKPQTDNQKSLQDRVQSLGHEIMLTRWVQIEQAQTTLPVTFLVILLFWLTMLYTTFGMLAPRNATVITVMFIGALAVATAVFLIVEMSHPMEGAMKVSSGPLRKALEHLGR